MAILCLRFLQPTVQEQSASNPTLLVSRKIQSRHRRAKLVQNQASIHFIILNGIVTLCKFVLTERCWQPDFLGNGKVRTPVPEEKIGLLLSERTS